MTMPAANGHEKARAGRATKKPLKAALVCVGVVLPDLGTITFFAGRRN